MNNYFRHSAELSAKAKDHFQKMEALYQNEIIDSYNNSLIFDDNINRSYNHDKVPEIELISCTTENAVEIAAKENYYPVILNFASYKNPGGKFMEGSSAQEESLCHVSTLYNVQIKFFNSYYSENRKNLNWSLYTNKCLYTPKIVFEKSDQQNISDYILADVLTIAAPNWNFAKKIDVSEAKNFQYLTSRINFVFDCANNINITNNPKKKVLILGAFGCGVFGQDPRFVSKEFLYYIDNGKASIFDKVIFAIPSGYNYDMFKKLIDNYKDSKGI